jgi:hypothetical protein
MSARDWITLWLVRHGVDVHQTMDPACAYRDYRPKPGSRLDRASRGIQCPRCFHRKAIR